MLVQGIVAPSSHVLACTSCSNCWAPVDSAQHSDQVNQEESGLFGMELAVPRTKTDIFTLCSFWCIKTCLYGAINSRIATNYAMFFAYFIKGYLLI